MAKTSLSFDPFRLVRAPAVPKEATHRHEKQTHRCSSHLLKQRSIFNQNYVYKLISVASPSCLLYHHRSLDQPWTCSGVTPSPSLHHIQILKVSWYGNSSLPMTLMVVVLILSYCFMQQSASCFMLLHQKYQLPLWSVTILLIMSICKEFHDLGHTIKIITSLSQDNCLYCLRFQGLSYVMVLWDWPSNPLSMNIRTCQELINY